MKLTEFLLMDLTSPLIYRRTEKVERNSVLHCYVGKLLLSQEKRNI